MSIRFIPFIRWLGGLSALLALSWAPARAADLAFTSDAARLREPLSLSAGKELDRFSGGAAVWGVLRPAPNQKDVSRYISVRENSPMIRVEVWLLNEYQNWDALFTQEISVTREQMAQPTFAFPILPDSYDLEAPGLRKLLDRMPGYGSKPMTFKVRIEGAERFGGLWVQSGFVLDLAKGLGRHADWLAQKRDTDTAQATRREAPLISARSAWLRAYMPPRTDVGIVQEITKWWGGTGAAANSLVKVFACSSDYDIVRNEFGIVQRRQACGLFVHKRGSEGKCFAQWRQFGYESLGGGAFDSQLKNWTPSGLVFDMGSQKLDAGRNYEVECAAVAK